MHMTPFFFAFFFTFP
ncbi:pheA operon leader peptide PheL [Sodalis ligni]|nr:pheA operon leader peptide PheL [Sodalis ligni]QWA14035.1 pheA operon leader peptide PheL [Sodalis ligni]